MKEIVLKEYEFNVINKTYYVYVKEAKDEGEFTHFYLGEKGNGIIEHMVGLEMGKDEIEEFINKTIIEWVYFYNKDFGN